MPREDSDYLVFRSDELALDVRGLFCSQAKEQAHTHTAKCRQSRTSCVFYKLTAWKSGGVCSSTWVLWDEGAAFVIKQVRCLLALV